MHPGAVALPRRQALKVFVAFVTAITGIGLDHFLKDFGRKLEEQNVPTALIGIYLNLEEA